MRGRPRISTLAQLHARCRPAENGCILYPQTAHPYGIVVTAHARMTPARAAWELANGRPMPKGLEPRHTCDTPHCVNPDHIKAGTHAQNMRDRSERGRCNARASVEHRLSPEAIEAILRLHSRGLPHTHIAPIYGVHPNCIGQVCRKFSRVSLPFPALQPEAA